MTKKEKWDKRYMHIANEISNWSSCYHASVGCVITSNNRIIATGYNGAPEGMLSCKDRGFCFKEQKGIKKGPEYCFAVHAEQNALAQAAKLGISTKDATLYCTHRPCSICAKMIINAGIKRIVYQKDYDDDFASVLLANIKIEQI